MSSGNPISLLLLSAFVAVSVQAEELSDTTPVAQLAEQAAALIGSDKVSEAFEALRPFYPIPKHEIDRIIYKLEQERPQVAAGLGRSLSMERVGVQILGDSFLRHVFLEKHEKHAVVWVFTFDRPKQGWIVNDVGPTPHFEGLFQWLAPPGVAPEAGTADQRT